jgi:phosphohistidine phosphatase
MKKLTIIRHAKAERPEGYATDFERPLNGRGRRDATLMGELLTHLAPPVDWWISSPALRTRQTTELMLAEYKNGPTPFWEPAVYEATAETLLEIIANIPQDIEHAVLVGHNTGLEELVAGLVSGVPARLNFRMPTAALVHLQMEIFWWNQIRWGSAQLELLVIPKIFKK